MNNGAKKLRTLELERDTPSPLQEMLTPEAIISKSQEAMRKAKTYNEAIPELTRISIQENLNLTIGKEFKDAVKEMDRRNLNK